MSVEQMPGFWGNRKAVVIGLGSDIGLAMAERLEKDGYDITGTTSAELDLASFVDAAPAQRWDLLLIAAGTMEPIGRFMDTDVEAWERAVRVNALGPLRVVRAMWKAKCYGAKVCFMGGPNLSKATPTYSAYRAGKAMIDSLIGTLNAEHPNTFYLLNPGVVNTKIHAQTLKAGSSAANYERVVNIVQGAEPSFSYDEVYIKLKILLGMNPFPENEGT